eukprot:UN22841
MTLNNFGSTPASCSTCLNTQSLWCKNCLTNVQQNSTQRC